MIGWKHYGDARRVDVPSYLADELRALVGSAGAVENAVELLIDAQDGLRVVNEAD